MLIPQHSLFPGHALTKNNLFLSMKVEKCELMTFEPNVS